MERQYAFGTLAVSARSLLTNYLLACAGSFVAVLTINAAFHTFSRAGFLSSEYIASLAKMSAFRAVFLIYPEYFQSKSWRYFVTCILLFPLATQIDLIVRTVITPSQWGMSVPWLGLGMVAVIEAGFGLVYACWMIVITFAWSRWTNR